MPSSSAIKVLIGLLATGALAQEAPIKICNSDACDYCPNALTTTGTGYPSCVIYDRDTVLGGKEADYDPETSGSRKLYYDIASIPSDSNCKTIIRTPANTDDPNCGVPIYGGKGGICFEGDTKATFMVQFCCGNGDCTSAGVSRRDGLATSTLSSAILRDAEGNIIVPAAVGDVGGDKFEVFMEDNGLNASSVVKSRSVSGTPIYRIGYAPEALVEKRACDTFVQDGDIYTKTGDKSIKVSRDICGAEGEITIRNEQSVSRTTTFGVSVSDPWGIISASTEFSTEESASQAHDYTITPKENQCGHVAFTPYYNCVKGTIADCDGEDQTGEVCTAKRISQDEIDGRYTFVQTS